MNVYKLRIDKAIESLEGALEVLLTEKGRLAAKIEHLSEENAKLKDLTQSASLELDGYIKELEEIRRKHGDSNTGN